MKAKVSDEKLEEIKKSAQEFVALQRVRNTEYNKTSGKPSTVTEYDYWDLEVKVVRQTLRSLGF